MSVNTTITDYKINYIGDFTPCEQNTLQKANFPLPHPIPAYEAKEIDGKRVSRTEDLAKRVNDAKKYDRLDVRFAGFLLAAAAIAAIALLSIFISPYIGFAALGITFLVGFFSPGVPLNQAPFVAIGAPFLLLASPFVLLFGKFDASLKIERSKLTENYDFLLEKKDEIKAEINTQLLTLKAEQKGLQEQEAALQTRSEENFNQVGEKPDAKIAKYHEEQRAFGPLRKTLGEKTNLINNFEKVLEKIKEVEEDKHE